MGWFNAPDFHPFRACVDLPSDTRHGADSSDSEILGLRVFGVDAARQAADRIERNRNFLLLFPIG